MKSISSSSNPWKGSIKSADQMTREELESFFTQLSKFVTGEVDHLVLNLHAFPGLNFGPIADMLKVVEPDLNVEVDFYTDLIEVRRV